MRLRGLGLASVVFLSLVTSLDAAMFVVSSTGDASDATPGDGLCDIGDGNCTLRAALEEANATAGADTIHFAIGSGAQTIAVGTPLPIFFEQVTIDGTTQPGYSGVPLIALDGGLLVAGLQVSAAADGSVVRGVAIEHFLGGIGIHGDGNTIEACSVTDNGGDGIAIQGGSNNTVVHNVIGFNGIYGVAVYESANYSFPLFTALSPDATVTVPSVDFHDLCSNFAHVAGTPIVDLFGRAFNENFGMRLTATMSISSPGSYTFDLQQLDDEGRLVIDAVELLDINGGDPHTVDVNLSAGDHTIEIDFWEGPGAASIRLAVNGPGTPTFSTSGNPGWLAELFQGRIPAEGNTISQNSIHDNGAQGIAISCCCNDQNDDGDIDSGANTFLNHPLFMNRTVNPDGSIFVEGTAPPNAIVEIFGSTNDSLGGEGKLYIASVTATPGGIFSTTITLAQPYYSLTATATDAAGNTSEFSPNFVVRPVTIEVTNTSDSGPGSLRAALGEANFDGVPSLITFHPSLAGSSIFVSTNLNTFAEDETTLNADINNDCVPDIEIFGTGAANVGLLVQSAHNTIRGLAINRFSHDAVALELPSAHHNEILCNHLGLNLAGTTAFWNGQDGVVVRNGAHDNNITRNFVGSFGAHGVLLDNANANRLAANTIGLGTNGAPLPSLVGVQVTNANGTLLGAVGEGNRIVAASAGISLSGSETDIIGNTIGWPPAMTPSGEGIVVQGPQMPVRIGNPSAAASNSIANNGGAGVRVVGVDNVTIRNNSIHGNGGLGIDLDGNGVTPNDGNGDPDNGANENLNFPVLTHAANTGSATQVEGFLDTSPGSYDLEIYVSGERDPSGHGEGEMRVLATAIVPGAFAFTLPSLPIGSFLTAITIDGSGNTSEFSLARQVAAPLGVTELVAYPAMPSGITLRWRDPQASETGFRIEWMSGSTWIPLTNVGPDVTTYTDTTVSPGTARSYRVVVTASPGVDGLPSSIAHAVAFSTLALQICRGTTSETHQSATSPSVVHNGTNWAIAWADRRNGRESDIFFQILNPDGTPNGAAVQITNDDVASTNPALVWNGTNYGLLWLDHLRGANGQPIAQLTFALLAPTGARIRGDVRITSTNAGSPHGNDHGVPLVWDGTGWGIFVSESISSPGLVVFYRLDADGDVLVNGTILSQTPWIQGNVSATWNGSEYGVAWVETTSETGGSTRFVRVQTNGVLISINQVGTNAGRLSAGSSVVWNGSGWAVASVGYYNGLPVIKLSRLNANGMLIGEPSLLIDGSVGSINTNPQLFLHPGGGYVVYANVSDYLSPIQEIVRFEADAGGQHIGFGIVISPNDGLPSTMPRAAFDGTSYLIAWNETRQLTGEIADAVVSTSGVVSAINDITSGHSAALASSWPSVLPMQNGFFTLWTESYAAVNQLHARIYRSNGTVVDRRPLNGANPQRRPVATTDGFETAVAWGDQTTQGVHVDRFDQNGDSLMGGGVRIANALPERGVGIAFDGEEFGVVWVHPTFHLYFQRMGHNTPIGVPTLIGAASGGGDDSDPQIQWVGSGYAIVWGEDHDLWYARVDASGALVVPQTRITDTHARPDFQLRWTGQHLALVTSENHSTAMPGADLYFTILDENGLKQFPTVLVVSTMNDDLFPALDFDGTNFRIVYPDAASGMREVQVTPNGTVIPGSTFLGNHAEGRVAVAYNGATMGVAWEHRGDLLFQTTQCLTDTSPPSCPTLNATFASGAVQLNWNAAADAQSPILAYHLYRDGRLLTELAPPTLAYSDGGFTPGAVYTYELRAFNGAYLESSGCTPKTVTAGIVVAPETLPNARQTTAYSQNITASQGTAPYTFAVTNGALPQGLTLSTGGLLSGTPTSGAGQYQFTVTATDNLGATGARTYLLLLCTASFVVPTVLPDPIVNTSYQQLLTVRDGSPPQSWSVTGGTLPSGLTLATSGLLSGTPITTGAFTFTVTATEASSCATTLAYSLTVLSGTAPRDVAALAQSSSSILVRWTRPQHGETGFRIERSSNGGSTWGSINIVGFDVTSHLDQGLAAATVYHYRVIAFNGIDSTASAMATARTFPLGPTKICAQTIGPYHSRVQNVSVAHNGTQWAAAWADRRDNRLGDILFQLLDNTTGAPVGAPVSVTATDMTTSIPMLRWNGTHFGLLYIEQMRSPAGAFATTLNFALLDAAGGVLRRGVRVYTGTNNFINSTFEHPFVWDGGGWGIFSIDTSGVPTDIVYRRLSPTGDLIAGPIAVANSASWDFDVFAVWNGTEYGAAWIEETIPGDHGKVYFRRMQADGTFLGAPVLIDESGDDSLLSPSVAWNGSEWAVAWQVVSGENIIRFRRLNPDGSPKHASVRLSDDPSAIPSQRVEDRVPWVQPKPGGGYFVFTMSRNWSVNLLDAARLEADADGNRVGSRVFLTPPDAFAVASIRVATDGNRFLLGHEAINAADAEGETTIVDATGTVTHGPTPLTTGHSGGASNAPTVVAMGADFAALWVESTTGSQIHAKIFDGGGNLSSTRIPLSPSTNVQSRLGFAAAGYGFGLAWRDDTNLRFCRYDTAGNAMIPESVVPGGGSQPSLAWNGEHFGLAFFEGNQLRFQKLGLDGNTVGPKIFISTGGTGIAPLIRWTGSGWAVVWRIGGNLWFTLLDRNGAFLVAPLQVTFHDGAPAAPQMDWSGDRLGLVWQEARLPDALSNDLWFTALKLDGTKAFEEKAITAGPFNELSPSIYWDADRFRVVHWQGDGGIREIAVQSDGTVLPDLRMLHPWGAQTGIAFNGITLAMLFNSTSDLTLQTSACFADTTAPACPNSTAIFDGQKVHITWSAVADPESGLSGYNVYRDGTQLAMLQSTTLLFDDFGFISGTNHAYEVRAVNRAGRESSGCTVHVVTAGISISPSTLPDGAVNFGYGPSITAAGGTQPYSFAITAGMLPPGISLVGAGPVTATLTGFPSAAGLFTFTVTATDALAHTGSREYTVRICAITLHATVLADGSVAGSYSQTLVASGATGGATFSLTSGSLPTGLTLDPTGWIHGIPAVAGTSSFTAAATDSLGCTTSRAYTIVIQNAGAARNLSAYALGTSSIRLRWTDPQRNETAFRIERSLDLGATWTAIAIVGANTVTYTNTSLAATTTYSYRVVATIPGGDAAPSNTGTATTWPATAAKTCIQQISPHHTFARAPSVVRAGSQWAMVYQDRVEGENDEIWFTFLDASGAMTGTPLRITNNDSVSIRPMMRWNGTNFGVMWIESLRGPHGEVVSLYRFALISGSGNLIRGDVRIPTPEVAGFAGLDLQFLWDGSAWGFFETHLTNDGLYDHFFYRLDEDGDPLAGPVRLTTHADYDYLHSAAWNGSEYGLTWLRGRDDQVAVVFQRFSGNGAPLGSPTVLASGHVDFVDVPDVAATPTGWAVAWADATNGIDLPVYLRRLDATGTPLGPAVRISDDVPSGLIQDSVAEIVALPSGELAIFTSSFISGHDETGMLRADASGNRIGTRVIISPSASPSSAPARIAFDGTNFLAAFNESRLGTLEIASVLVDTTGSPVAGPTDLTAGHDVGGGSGLPQLVALGGGFAALWTEAVPNDVQLHAKIYDGNGNLASTKFPLTTHGIRGRYGVVSAGSTFAVAFRDAANAIVFRRYDAAGNPLMAEVTAVSGVNGLSAMLLGFDGANYAIVWNQGGNLRFQRVTPNGTPVGAQSILAPVPSSPFMQMAWTGSGWAIVFAMDGDIHYMLLDAAGAVLAGPVRVSFHPGVLTRGIAIAWNGDALGIAWASYFLPDPPGLEVKFTVVGLDGIKQFEERTVSEGPIGPNLQGLTWTGDRFRVAHVPNDSGAMFEVDYDPAGTLLGTPRLLSSRSSNLTSVVWNGATSGVLWTQLGELFFETTACLADATPPACPAVNATRSAAGVTLTWPAVTDAQSTIYRYMVYRDGAVISEVSSASTSYLDSGVRLTDQHDYRVTAVNGAFGESTGCPTFALIGAPSALVATATSSTQVQIAWQPVAGATQYVVERSSDGVAFTSVGTPTASPWTDPTAQANIAYLYRVRAMTPQQTSGPSNIDFAVTTLFTNDPLNGSTPVQSIHTSQLRTAVDALRALAQLTPGTYTHSAGAGTPVRAVDVNELRLALTQACTALGIAPPAYTDTIAAGTMKLKAVHLQEIRNALR